MARSHEKQAREVRLYPMHLQLGDLLVDEHGEWKVIGEASREARAWDAMLRLRRVSMIAAMSLLASVATARERCRCGAREVEGTIRATIPADRP